MKLRGKVLREPNAGPGLIMVEGQQYKFSLDDVWKSETLPKPGLDVEVDLDQNLQILAITAIPESQIAKEQAEKAMAKAKEKSGELFRKVIAKCGAPALVAALLVLGWLFLTTVSVRMPLVGKLDFTFWQVLGFVNANNSLEALDRSGQISSGFYGFFALIALAGPFVHHVWKDKRAVLGGLAPLVFMVIVGVMARSSFQSAFGGNVPGEFGEMARQAQAEAMKGISLGVGAYFSGMVSLYFAAVGTRRFLAERAVHPAVAAIFKEAA